ncbi:MAG: hypothetical protein RIQ66_229, partial [Pseudomonadota bacterium]
MPTELSTSPTRIVSVAVDAPLPGVLDYRDGEFSLSHGDWVEVPLGRRKVLGVVVDPRRLEQLSGQDGRQEITPDRLKSVIHHFSNLAPAEPKWLELASFAARYYRKPFGQIAVGLVPKWLRDLKNLIPKKESGPSNLDRLLSKSVNQPAQAAPIKNTTADPRLNAEQLLALGAIDRPGVHVLHGVTGSGKTRVYTEAARRCITSGQEKQVLVMVPEIGLTPQLVSRFAAALPGIEIAVLHSEVSERERARLWLLAASGQARLVIGTRLSIMTPMPHLALLIVDEEHDHSYKQQ